MPGAEHLRELMGEAPVVRLSPAADLGRVKLSAMEGFVLSRVDGKSDLRTLCQMTGLGEAQTLEILGKLHEEGVILVGDEEVTQRTAPPEMPRQAGNPAGPGPEPASADPGPPPAPRPAPGPPPARREDLDLEPPEDAALDLKPDVRKMIRTTYARLGQMNLFELIGAEPRSDEKDLRKAYFARSKLFHPDRYYNRNIGRYGPMLHAIFNQLSAAYKLLSDEAQREEYRRGVLEQQEQEDLARQVERQREAALEEERGEAPEGEPVPAAEIRDRARDFRSGRVKQWMERVRRSSEMNVPVIDPAQLAAADEPESEERRKQREAERRLRTERMTGGLFSRAKKAQQFYAQGKGQLERGQFLAAAASLRLAVEYSPEDAEYRKAYERAQEQAKELTAETYYKRAMMEESVGRFDAAAENFIKAAEQLPRPNYLSKAAECMLWSRDLIKAKDYATRAVQANPNSVDIRMVAAKVYKAAGMKLNARRELQQALKMDPSNAEAKELMKIL